MTPEASAGKRYWSGVVDTVGFRFRYPQEGSWPVVNLEGGHLSSEFRIAVGELHRQLQCQGEDVKIQLVGGQGAEFKSTGGS